MNRYFALLICLFFLPPSAASAEPLKSIESRCEEVRFSVDWFDIVGDLHLPSSGERYPAVIFVHGDGPARRNSSYYTQSHIDIFLEMGFACLFYDKPGYGASKGEFRRGKLFDDRASILVGAVEFLKKHGAVDPSRIGLWGISQAGYVMPLAFTQTEDIAFLIAVSCPAEDSLRQSAYLVKKQVLCDGYREEEAEKARLFFIQRSEARTYREYLEAAEFLDQQPAVKSLGWGGVRSEEDFSPLSSDHRIFFNPIDLVQQIKVPVLAVFGDRDTQVDPFQGVEAYQRALKKAGNPFFQVKLFPGANHGIMIAETGCLKEQRERYNSGKPRGIVPEYLELLRDWLQRLHNYWEGHSPGE